MEVKFLSKLKAEVTKNYVCDIEIYYKEYKIITHKLDYPARENLSLNTLCIICRNFDKVPSWGNSVDNEILLSLCIDCFRQTEKMEQEGVVKRLACIFHIQRYFVHKKTLVNPKLVLKVSHMAFEADTKDLLKEYNKTYCSIVFDRLTYIERLKTKANINEFLPKLSEDILKIVELYDTVQFCSTMLMFLLKKLNFLYSMTCPQQVNELFKNIFSKLASKNDEKLFRKLQMKELMELYKNFNNCLYIIVENSAKSYFQESVLSSMVTSILSMIGHVPDFRYCYKTYYLNSFCHILSENQIIRDNSIIFKELLNSLEKLEKTSYSEAVNMSYPFLSQFIRLYLEKLSKQLSIEVRELCLKLILYFVRKLKDCSQFLKCDACDVQTGLHDSLRMCLLAKVLMYEALDTEYDIKESINTYLKIVYEQNISLKDLARSGCKNYQNYYKKLQADVHNVAISLNRVKYYEQSIKLFDMYIELEIDNFKTENELKNISRALYNKSICELNYKLYEKALIDAFLSLIFARDEGLNDDKNIGLVIEVKSKALKDKSEEYSNLQLVTVLEACKIALKREMYGNIRQFLVNIKFSAFLKHEFDMYASMWPSLAPIAGVWNSLLQLTQAKTHDWIIKENNDMVLWTLNEVVLETPVVVRAIHNDIYKSVVTKLLDDLDRKQDIISGDIGVVHATLMFLKTEYDMTDAALRHNWKDSEPNMDPDRFQGVRTIPDEYMACNRALKAVDMWTVLAKNLGTVSRLSCLRKSLQVCEVFVPQLLRMYHTAAALQLAYNCCLVAKHVDDMEPYVRNTGVLLRHVEVKCEELDVMMSLAFERCPKLLANEVSTETAITFICDAAIYHKRCGSVGISARLVQQAQARVLAANEKYPHINLDLAVGRLLEAQSILCGETCNYSALSMLNGIQRHYLFAGNNSTKWSSRRLRALFIKYGSMCGSVACLRTMRALRVWRRARGVCGAALPGACAFAQGLLYALVINAHHFEDAQVKIDNKLKYILGLQQWNGIVKRTDDDKFKEAQFTPRQEIETMLDNFIVKKNDSSPFLDQSVSRFKPPHFFHHDSTCDCYCQLPQIYVLACHLSILEASMYFRANEKEIADNYFEGAKKMLDFAEKKFVLKNWGWESFIVEGTMKWYRDELRKLRVEFFVEMAFFELSKGSYESADDLIVTIHEICELGSIDQYLTNEIMNLMIASANLKGVVKKPELGGLEIEFEDLKLTPSAVLCTPVNKVPFPKSNKPMVVKDEEILKLRKVLKLNLDDSDDKDDEKSEFKVPDPVSSKNVLEDITPGPPKRHPRLMVIEPSPRMVTPKGKENEFFTPMSTPTVKTYLKVKSGVVKKLDDEFSTPVGKVDNSGPSKTRSRGLKTLKRATSPGKLDNELKVRTRRQLKISGK